MMSFIDNSILNLDRALRTLVPNAAKANRPSPANAVDEAPMDEQDKRHSIGLMRINHTGEVCAQALYSGQALTAKLPSVREEMDEAAAEEIDHLVWCEQRLHELGSHTSLLNPLFFGASFAIGAGAGLISARLSLGFVAATEEQVCLHIDKHLDSLPHEDEKSKAILNQMRIDEAKHKIAALESGGLVFPETVMKTMTLISKVMTKSTYRV